MSQTLVDGGILYSKIDKFYPFRRRHCISIDLTDGTKLDNGLTELLDYAITHHYPTLRFLSTTGPTPFVEDMIRKYEHVI